MSSKRGRTGRPRLPNNISSAPPVDEGSSSQAREDEGSSRKKRKTFTTTEDESAHQNPISQAKEHRDNFQGAFSYPNFHDGSFPLMDMRPYNDALQFFLPYLGDRSLNGIRSFKNCDNFDDVVANVIFDFILGSLAHAHQYGTLHPLLDPKADLNQPEIAALLKEKAHLALNKYKYPIRVERGGFHTFDWEPKFSVVVETLLKKRCIPDHILREAEEHFRRNGFQDWISPHCEKINYEKHIPDFLDKKETNLAEITEYIAGYRLTFMIHDPKLKFAELFHANALENAAIHAKSTEAYNTSFHSNPFIGKDMASKNKPFDTGIRVMMEKELAKKTRTSITPTESGASGKSIPMEPSLTTIKNAGDFAFYVGAYRQTICSEKQDDPEQVDLNINPHTIAESIRMARVDPNRFLSVAKKNTPAQSDWNGMVPLRTADWHRIYDKFKVYPPQCIPSFRSLRIAESNEEQDVYVAPLPTMAFSLDDRAVFGVPLVVLPHKVATQYAAYKTIPPSYSLLSQLQAIFPQDIYAAMSNRENHTNQVSSESSNLEPFEKIQFAKKAQIQEIEKLRLASIKPGRTEGERRSYAVALGEYTEAVHHYLGYSCDDSPASASTKAILREMELKSSETKHLLLTPRTHFEGMDAAGDLICNAYALLRRSADVLPHMRSLVLATFTAVTGVFMDSKGTTTDTFPIHTLFNSSPGDGKSEVLHKIKQLLVEGTHDVVNTASTQAFLQALFLRFTVLFNDEMGDASMRVGEFASTDSVIFSHLKMLLAHEVIKHIRTQSADKGNGFTTVSQETRIPFRLATCSNTAIPQALKASNPVINRMHLRVLPVVINHALPTHRAGRATASGVLSIAGTRSMIPSPETESQEGTTQHFRNIHALVSFAWINACAKVIIFPNNPLLAEFIRRLVQSRIFPEKEFLQNRTLGRAGALEKNLRMMAACTHIVNSPASPLIDIQGNGRVVSQLWKNTMLHCLEPFLGPRKSTAAIAVAQFFLEEAVTAHTTFRVFASKISYDTTNTRRWIRFGDQSRAIEIMKTPGWIATAAMILLMAEKGDIGPILEKGGIEEDSMEEATLERIQETLVFRIWNVIAPIPVRRTDDTIRRDPALISIYVNDSDVDATCPETDLFSQERAYTVLLREAKVQRAGEETHPQYHHPGPSLHPPQQATLESFGVEATHLPYGQQVHISYKEIASANPRLLLLRMLFDTLCKTAIKAKNLTEGLNAQASLMKVNKVLTLEELHLTENHPAQIYHNMLGVTKLVEDHFAQAFPDSGARERAKELIDMIELRLTEIATGKRPHGAGRFIYDGWIPTVMRQGDFAPPDAGISTFPLNSQTVVTEPQTPIGEIEQGNHFKIGKIISEMPKRPVFPFAIVKVNGNLCFDPNYIELFNIHAHGAWDIVAILTELLKEQSRDRKQQCPEVPYYTDIVSNTTALLPPLPILPLSMIPVTSAEFSTLFDINRLALLEKKPMRVIKFEEALAENIEAPTTPDPQNPNPGTHQLPPSKAKSTRISLLFALYSAGGYFDSLMRLVCSPVTSPCTVPSLIPHPDFPGYPLMIHLGPGRADQTIASKPEFSDELRAIIKQRDPILEETSKKSIDPNIMSGIRDLSERYQEMIHKACEQETAPIQGEEQEENSQASQTESARFLEDEEVHFYKKYNEVIGYQGEDNHPSRLEDFIKRQYEATKNEVSKPRNFIDVMANNKSKAK